jgi:hypothetical protein
VIGIDKTYCRPEICVSSALRIRGDSIVICSALAKLGKVAMPRVHDADACLAPLSDALRLFNGG